MKLLDGGLSAILIGAVLLTAVALIGIGSKYVFNKDDNPVEEEAERIIKDKTGIDIDFTPNSKEPD